MSARLASGDFERYGASGFDAADIVLRRHEQYESKMVATWEDAGFGETAILELHAENEEPSLPHTDASLLLGPDEDDDGREVSHSVREGDVMVNVAEVSQRRRGNVTCCGGRKENVSAPVMEKPKHQLNQWFASAISGNDITSSVLYMGGLCTAQAGPFAPISIVLVVGLLYLFRSVYSEVVTALPLNGGAYNALLNTTSKVIAAVGGTLTVLSYVATAVVSADSAVQYFVSLLPQVPPFWLPVGVLGIFAILNLIGLTESSVVALIIFVVHMLVLAVLTVASLVYLFQNNWPLMVINWSSDVRDLFGNPAYCIAFGFGAALLGVSGFESSANYVEEQAPGVFPKTLRNMWIAVAFFNPILTLLASGMLPVTAIRNHTSVDCAILNTTMWNGTHSIADPLPCDPMLSMMARVAGGEWLHVLVGIDATLVLCGAVLTAYVGVGGLMRRMSLDRCLPGFFLMQNPLTKTNHFIIVGFFATTASLYLIVRGDINTLSGVYALAFLCVMALFALANMLLKYKVRRAVNSLRMNSFEQIIVLLLLCSVER
jgi:amino acid transporter